VEVCATLRFPWLARQDVRHRADRTQRHRSRSAGKCGKSSWAPVKLSCGADSTRNILAKASVVRTFVARTPDFGVRGSYCARTANLKDGRLPSSSVARARTADKGGGATLLCTKMCEAPWTAAARRRFEIVLRPMPKAPSSRRSPRCFARFHLAPWDTTFPWPIDGLR